MISVFIIGIIVVITFRAVGTSHENKSPIDRFGEIVSNKDPNQTELKSKKKERPIITIYYLKTRPTLTKVWKRCSMEEKEKISEAIGIIHSKKEEIAKEEGDEE